MVNFKLLEVKGEYDFGSKSSEYKANIGLGKAEVTILTICVNMTPFRAVVIARVCVGRSGTAHVACSAFTVLQPL